MMTRCRNTTRIQTLSDLSADRLAKTIALGLIMEAKSLNAEITNY